MTTTPWEEKSVEERRQIRFEKWLNPESISFASESVRSEYQQRVQRVIDAIELKKTPDRVPTLSPAGLLPCFLYDRSCRDAMYDIDLAIELWERFAREYPADLTKIPGTMGIGNALEILDYGLYKWPGFGLPDNVGFQATELETMKVEDYRILVEDPTDMWLRRQIPRSFGALEALSGLPSLTHLVEIPQVRMLAAFGRPEVAGALKKLIRAGEELLESNRKLGVLTQKLIGEVGTTLSAGGGAKAPFDVLADTLRGTNQMMFDMYRHKEKIEEAVDRITPLQINAGVSGVNASGNPLVFIPLHKGADGFMSDEQFSQLYWPSLKDLIDGLVAEGCVPFLFAEGGYNSRLDYLNELANGTTLWLFDQTDMAEAKQKVGKNVCIAGNVPSGLMITGSADQVDDYCRKLIDECAPGGGYILAAGVIIDEGKADTTRSMMDAAMKYGNY